MCYGGVWLREGEAHGIGIVRAHVLGQETAGSSGAPSLPMATSELTARGSQLTFSRGTGSIHWLGLPPTPPDPDYFRCPEAAPGLVARAEPGPRTGDSGGLYGDQSPGQERNQEPLYGLKLPPNFG